MLRQMRFDKVHIAAYSPRPQTAASRNLRDDVTQEIKEARRAQAEALQNDLAAEINAAFLGNTVEVLVDDQKKGKWCGRTRGDKLVFFASKASLMGQLAKVTIDKTSPFALQGTLA